MLSVKVLGCSGIIDSVRITATRSREIYYNEGDFFLNFNQVTLKSVAEMRNVDSEHDKKYASYTKRWQDLDTVGETVK